MTAETLQDAGFDWSELAEPEKAEPVASATLGTSRSKGGSTTRSKPGIRLERKLAALQAKLNTEMFAAGSLIGLGLPVTGYYIAQESDNFTKAIVELAANKPEWIDALEMVANVGPGITIGRVVIGMGASLAVDRGRIERPQDSAPLRFLGVYSAWAKVHGRADFTPTEGSSYVPPPRFQPVS